MYSKQGNHVEGYKQWSNFKGQKIRVDGKTITVPTFAENLQYFLSYQVNFMYWRYFLWNFSGRQSDVQSYGEIDRGNWITGIKFIDEILVGDQDHMPASISENKGHNVYYMLPLILGLIGLLWQAFSGQKGIQGFWVVFFLFFMTGLAIVLYLNQTPYQPRERDYAYAGSFYAFSIWVGMGVAGLVAIVEQLTKKQNAVISAILGVLCLGVPFQMVGQNWDDHDRSDRFTARDFGKNYLTSLEPNAIIFTNGDNDTFPLWYNQEVEGYRTDVRVCNLSYLQTDWYINQMKSQAYESDPLPISFTPAQYVADLLNYAYVNDETDGKEASFAAVMDQFYKDKLRKYDDVPIVPATKMYINIDSAAVANSPVIDTPDKSLISKRMHIDLSNKRYITKNEIAMLSMIDNIARDGWKRPIYFATTVGSEMYLSLNRYFRLVGLAYQIVPLENGGTSSCDIDKTYDNMMNKFVWGNIQDPSIYLDENNRRMCRTQRMMFVTMIDELLDKGDTVRALAATEYCDKTIPSVNVPYDYTALTLAQTYYLCDKPEEGSRIVGDILAQNEDYLQWVFRLDKPAIQGVGRTIREQLLTMRDALQMAQDAGDHQFDEEYADKFRRYFDLAYDKYKLLK